MVLRNDRRLLRRFSMMRLNKWPFPYRSCRRWLKLHNDLLGNCSARNLSALSFYKMGIATIFDLEGLLSKKDVRWLSGYQSFHPRTPRWTISLMLGKEGKWSTCMRVLYQWGITWWCRVRAFSKMLALVLSGIHRKGSRIRVVWKAEKRGL